MFQCINDSSEYFDTKSESGSESASESGFFEETEAEMKNAEKWIRSGSVVDTEKGVIFETFGERKEDLHDCIEVTLEELETGLEDFEGGFINQDAKRVLDALHFCLGLACYFEASSLIKLIKSLTLAIQSEQYDWNPEDRQRFNHEVHRLTSVLVHLIKN